MAPLKGIMKLANIEAKRIYTGDLSVCVDGIEFTRLPPQSKLTYEDIEKAFKEFNFISSAVSPSFPPEAAIGLFI